MTSPEHWEWTAVALFEYPVGVAMAWEGLTKILLDGLQERGPAAQPRISENKLMLAFGVHGASEEEAVAEAKSSLVPVIGANENAWAALCPIRVLDSEKLDQSLKEIEKEKQGDTRKIFTRTDTTSLIPNVVEYRTPAEVINFPSTDVLTSTDQE